MNMKKMRHNNTIWSFRENRKLSCISLVIFVTMVTLIFISYLERMDIYFIRISKNTSTNNSSLFQLSSISLETTKKFPENFHHQKYNSFQKEIVIGTVVCRKPGDYGPRVETAVMMKSIIISSLLHKQISQITFLLFIEYQEDKDYFLEKLAEYGHPPPSQVDVTSYPKVEITFHSVVDSMPKEYHNKMIFSDIRCAYIRCFFPIILPDLDSILYLDTDTIVTGNIAEVWSYLDKMEGEQLIGAVMDFEPENPNFDVVHDEAFGDIPIPTSKGLNSGVLLMNLTKMRENNWAEKALQIWLDYEATRPIMEDQRLINILLFYDSGLLKLLPCNFNFRPGACILGLYCTATETDPLGVQIIHQWYDPNYVDDATWNAFWEIAHVYQMVDLTDANVNLFRDLMNPIRNLYSNLNSINSDIHVQCDGVLNEFLFKNYF